MSEVYDCLITKVLHHYFPQWEPPDNRKDWNPCLCPDHVEERPSCSVNYEVGAVKCQACGFKGNVVSIIQRKEGLRYAEAVRYAEELFGGGHKEIQSSATRKSGRRVFGDTGFDESGYHGGGKQVLSRIRGRSAPWS